MWETILVSVLPTAIGIILTALVKDWQYRKKNGNGSRMILASGKILEATAHHTDDLVKQNKEYREEIERMLGEKINYCSNCPIKKLKE